MICIEKQKKGNIYILFEKMCQCFFPLIFFKIIFPEMLKIRRTIRLSCRFSVLLFARF